jgi:4-carboxymuconolactone decarboxylase
MRHRTAILRLSPFALALTFAIAASAAAQASPSGKDVQMVAPALDKYTQDRVLGEVWKRSGFRRAIEASSHSPR